MFFWIKIKIKKILLIGKLCLFFFNALSVLCELVLREFPEPLLGYPVSRDCRLFQNLLLSWLQQCAACELHFKPQSPVHCPVISLAMEEALPLLRENSSNSYRQSRCYIPARYVLAALSCSGFCVMYLLRVNLSVALVAMVNSTYANEQASANNPECQRNSSTDSEKKVRRKGV